MSLPLISFFLSLTGIVIMIGRKVMKLQGGQIINEEHLYSYSRHIIPDLQKIKQSISSGTKRFGYATLFATFRFFIKSFNFIKVKSKIFLKETKNKFKKNKENLIEEVVEKKEVSKYLRIISEYREKIKKMKHRIKKEEGIE